MQNIRNCKNFTLQIDFLKGSFKILFFKRGICRSPLNYLRIWETSVRFYPKGNGDIKVSPAILTNGRAPQT